MVGGKGSVKKADACARTITVTVKIKKIEIADKDFKVSETARVIVF